MIPIRLIDWALPLSFLSPRLLSRQVAAKPSFDPCEELVVAERTAVGAPGLEIVERGALLDRKLQQVEEARNGARMKWTCLASGNRPQQTTRCRATRKRTEQPSYFLF